MRNGKALLTQTALAAACTFCLIVWGAAPGAAAEQQKTDSGAPAATVMFPVTDKAASKAVMKPVVFNHQNHEKAVKDCKTCHHTGEPQSCTDCHTVKGKKEGKFVTLEQAMHATKIRASEDGTTPSSCVSCHSNVTQQGDCAGCHSVLKPSRDKNWCAVCHNVAATPEQLSKGMTNTLSSAENQALAQKTVSEAKPVPAPESMGPTKVTIDALANEFQANVFNHRRHMESLKDRIKDSKLAGAFHNQPETLCSTCHHQSPLSVTPPKCSSCHQATVDPKNPDRPNLKAAYHLQCMGCHQGMNVHRPQNTSCATCHKPAEKAAAADAPVAEK